MGLREDAPVTTQFVVPTPDQMPDALNASDPDSAVNRLWRMYNERRLVVAYPNNQTISNNAKLSDYPFLRYRSGYVPFDGGIFSGFGRVPVTNFTDAIIEAGSDVQDISFWNSILVDIYNWAAGYFALVSEVESGIAGKDYSNRWGPTLYGQVSFLFQDAGIQGVERRSGEDINTISGYGNFYQAGDIIGPWVFRDIAWLLSLLKYRYIVPTRLKGVQRQATTILEQSYEAHIDTLFNGFQNYRELRNTEQPFVAFDIRPSIYSISSVLNYANEGALFPLYNGEMERAVRSPGYIPYVNLGEVAMTVDAYGVADRLYANNYFDSNNYDERPLGYAENMAVFMGSYPAPARSNSVQYVQIPDTDVRDGDDPYTVHGIAAVPYDVSLGMRVAKPFLIGKPAYEFEGVLQSRRGSKP